MDLFLSLFRRQAGPVNIGLEAFELLIPLGFVLGPFPLDERSESLLRGESGPGVIFRQVIRENAGEYPQQGVKSPVAVLVRTKKARRRVQTWRARRAFAPTSEVQSKRAPGSGQFLWASCRLSAGRL